MPRKLKQDFSAAEDAVSLLQGFVLLPRDEWGDWHRRKALDLGVDLMVEHVDGVFVRVPLEDLLDDQPSKTGDTG